MSHGWEPSARFLWKRILTNPVYADERAARRRKAPAAAPFQIHHPRIPFGDGQPADRRARPELDRIYNKTPVALVSENMAREHWRDPRAAIGKRIRATLGDDWREVIGVVADLRDDGIDQKPPGVVYWPVLRKNSSGGASAVRGLAYVIRTPRAGSTGLAAGDATGRGRRQSEPSARGCQDDGVDL